MDKACNSSSPTGGQQKAQTSQHAGSCSSRKCVGCAEEETRPRVKIQCKTCNKKFCTKSKFLLVAHLKSGFCQICKRKFACETRKKIHESLTGCKTKKNDKFKKGGSKDHQRGLHFPAQQIEQQETCTHCDRKMQSWYRHSVVKQECDWCEQVFICEGLFQNHLPCQSRPTAPSCGFCQEIFKNQDVEIAHHRQWTCGYCSELVECTTMRENHQQQCNHAQTAPACSTKSAGISIEERAIEQPEVIDLIDDELD